MFKSMLAVLGCAALIASVSSCSAEAGDAGPTAPEASGTVTLVTYDSYAISKNTLKQFSKETGLTVDVVRAGDAAEVVNRAILTKSAPEGDVLFGVDNNLLSRVLDEGLFTPYRSAALDRVPADVQLDPENHVTPIDVGDVCVNYDREFFAQAGFEPPKRLAGLAKPRYRDLLVVQNPSTSTPGLAFLLATVAEFGPERYLDYWKRLRDNGVQVENSWDAAYQREFSGGSGAGDRPLVVSYASSPPAEVVYSDRDMERAPTGVLLPTCYRQIEFAGLLEQAPNPSGGRQLIDFMLSDTYQADLPLNNFVFPVVPEVELPQVFEDNAEVAPNALSLPPTEVAANRDAWVSGWTDVMQR